MSMIIGTFYGNNGKYVIFKQSSQIPAQEEIKNTISNKYKYIDSHLFPIGSKEDGKQGDSSYFDGYLLNDIFNLISSVKDGEKKKVNSLFKLLFIAGKNEHTDIFFDNGSFISKKNSWKEIALSNHAEGTSAILSGNPYVIENYYILRDSQSTSLNIIDSFSGDNGEYVIIKQEPDDLKIGSQLVADSLSQGYNYIPNSQVENIKTEFDGYRLINIFQKIEQATSGGTIKDKDTNPHINTIFILGETKRESFYRSSSSRGSEIIRDNSHMSEFMMNNQDTFLTFSRQTSNNYVIMKQPTARICFLENTPVVTDQGELPIQDITSDNTIYGRFVERVTRFINQDNFMIMIKKDSFGFQLPSQDTLISQHHRVYIGKEGVKAKYLVNNDTIYKYETGHQPIYNVLLEGDKKGKMNVNNLIVETLDRKYLLKIFGNRTCRKH